MKANLLVATAVVFAGTGALAAALGTRTPVVNGDRSCAAADRRIVVDLTKHVLTLCDERQAVGEEQKKLGYTGSAVGIHGPPRWAR